MRWETEKGAGTSLCRKKSEDLQRKNARYKNPANVYFHHHCMIHFHIFATTKKSGVSHTVKVIRIEYAVE